MLFVLKVFLVLISFLHIYFLYLEMFAWTKALGLRVFRQSLEQAKASQVLAANQGLYNGFLAAGLIWSALETNLPLAQKLALFFLSCVFVAGAFGGWTVNRRIFFIQAGPAAVALLMLGLN